MRPVIQLLHQLRSLNVSLSLDGDTLKISAPRGVLTEELRRELGERKPDIVKFLRSSRQAAERERSIPRVDRSGPLPLSLAQQRLWFLTQLDPDSSVYNIGVMIRMRGTLSVPALEAALQQIVHRHESLRTRFLEVDGVPQSVIDDGSAWRLRLVDAHGCSDESPDSELIRIATACTYQPFDVARDPLFRADLLVIGPQDHLLVLTLHHLVCDGWSMGALGGELAQLYPAYLSGAQPVLAPLPVQYADFAAWQREWLESGELDRQLPYWKKQLAGAPPVLGFPADHRRPPAEMYRGRRAKLVIPRELAAALERLSQSQGVTLFMTLLAAFNVLLARYSGQDDIVIGSSSANRSRSELNPLIGFFINNLVLRTDLSGNPSFAELLRRVRQVTLQSYEHQDVPFDVLVRALQPERSLDHSPLFQVMFILQSFPMDDLALPGLKVTPVESDVLTARFDLTVEVFPRFGELWAYFDYNCDLYEAETIARIQQHYLAILQAVVQDVNSAIGAIPLLSDSERHRLLVESNQTEAPIPSEICFPHRFRQHVDKTPNHVAIVAGNQSFTYAELDRRATSIALRLRALGAGPGKLVALCFSRSADLVAAMLGIAMSGAAYIPLDPAYPRARVEHILEDAHPLVLLTGGDLLPSMQPIAQAADVPLVLIDDIPAAPESGNPPLHSETQQDLAYVIFTSGSTGRPKGVEITHRSLVNFLESMQAVPGMHADDVLLAVTTPSFDIAALELLLPLYTGATVCIALEPSDPAALLYDLERYRPTLMQATPATWKLLVAAGWKGDPQLKILCGGEALDNGLARSLLVRSKSLWNMYGPTETTIWSAALHVQAVVSEPVPIGQPIRNTSFYVVNGLGQPVPPGVAGELWIGGEGVARGYLNRPELTAERFLAAPFAEQGTAARVYRTGDLVRHRADGTLEFLGRIDHQVKLRGFRIELGEIESALRSCPGVLDAVVLLRADADDKRLVGYVACGSGPSPAESDLRAALRATLPEYMVPSAFVALPEFPRLPNGKLDRSALPAPERASGSEDAAFTPPVTGLQQTIAEIFRNLLGVERVGLDQNFFDLGAHSLQIVKAHSELNRSLEKKIMLVALFQHPTIRSLAEYMERENQAHTTDAYSSGGNTLPVGAR